MADAAMFVSVIRDAAALSLPINITGDVIRLCKNFSK